MVVPCEYSEHCCHHFQPLEQAIRQKPLPNITGRSHLNDQKRRLHTLSPGMEDLEYRTTQLQLVSPTENQSTIPLHSSRSLKAINPVMMKTRRMPNGKRRDKIIENQQALRTEEMALKEEFPRTSEKPWSSVVRKERPLG